MYPYLSEQVMHQFGYLKIILRPPHEYAPPSVPRRDLQAILNDFESHLIPKEYPREPTHVHWICVEGYMTWFYRVSHHIMTPDAPREPPRPANQEVLQVRDEQEESAMMVCWRVVEMGIVAIESRLFMDESPQLSLV